MNDLELFILYFFSLTAIVVIGVGAILWHERRLSRKMGSFEKNIQEALHATDKSARDSATERALRSWK